MPFMKEKPYFAATSSTTFELTGTQNSSRNVFVEGFLLSTPKNTLTGRRMRGTKALGFDGMCFCDAALNCPGKDFTGARASQHRRERMISTCERATGKISVRLDNADFRTAISLSFRSTDDADYLKRTYTRMHQRSHPHLRCKEAIHLSHGSRGS